jgi:tartrate dehydrogenase/decarboxylase/D-malate dehydrogenase
MPEGLRVLEAAARRFGFAAENSPRRLGQLRLLRCSTRPDDARRLEGAAAGHGRALFGAVGWPATVPDHVSLWGSLLKFRREFDQYINLRPARLFEGVPCPLAGPQGPATSTC